MSTQQAEPVEILIEVSPAGVGYDYGEEVMRGLGSNLKRFSREQLAGALATIREIATETRRMVGELLQRPEHQGLTTVEVEFGLKFSSELQAYVAKTGGDASMKITLTWDTRQDT